MAYFTAVRVSVIESAEFAVKRASVVLGQIPRLEAGSAAINVIRFGTVQATISTGEAICCLKMGLQKVTRFTGVTAVLTGVKAGLA